MACMHHDLFCWGQTFERGQLVRAQKQREALLKSMSGINSLRNSDRQPGNLPLAFTMDDDEGALLGRACTIRRVPSDPD